MYKCLRCGYTNKLKTNFIRHLNRKYTCKPKIKNITINKVFEYYFGNNKYSKLTQNDSKMGQKRLKMTQNDSFLLRACEHCNKIFSRKSNLIRHYKTCKEKKTYFELKNLKKLVKLLNDQLKEKDKQMTKQLKEKDKQINELIKKVGINISNNHIQNNIKILAYNKTDISHLKDKDYIDFLKHSNFCVPHMIKKIHFDPTKPENHNIYISNLKNNNIMVYDGNKWNINDRSEIIEDLLEDNTNILEDKIENWIERGKEFPEIMKKFNRYLDKKEEDNVKIKSNKK